MALDSSMPRLVLARFISTMGGHAAIFVGIWGTAAFELKADTGSIAILTAVVAIVTLASSLVTGALVDRYDPRKVMIAGDLLFVPTALAAVLADTMVELTVAASAMALFSSVVFTSITAFAPYLTDDDAQFVKINSRIESAGMAGFIAGPAVGAAMAYFASLDWIFVLDAATSLVAVVLILPVQIRQVQKHAHRRNATSALAEIREGFGYCYSNYKLRFFILANTSVWLILGAFRVLEPLYFRDVLQVSASVLGLIVALFGAGMVFGSLLVMRLPPFIMTARGLTVVLILNGLSAVAYSGTDVVGVVIAAAIVWGTLLGVMMTTARTLIHRNSPAPLIGRVAGTVAFHRELAALVPLAVLPTIAAAAGVQHLMVGAGVCVVAGGVLIGWPIAMGLDKMRDPIGVPDAPR